MAVPAPAPAARPCSRAGPSARPFRQKSPWEPLGRGGPARSRQGSPGAPTPPGGLATARGRAGPSPPGRGPNGGRGDFCREACDLVVSARPGQDDGINLTEVAAALAVLAGIAAADAACCHRLGVRSRGQDHARAIELVKQVVPRGDDLARASTVSSISRATRTTGSPESRKATHAGRLSGRAAPSTTRAPSSGRSRLRHRRPPCGMRPGGSGIGAAATGRRPLATTGRRPPAMPCGRCARNRCYSRAR